MSKVIILLLCMIEIFQRSFFKKIHSFRREQYCKIKEKAIVWHSKSEALTFPKVGAFSLISHTCIKAAKWVLLSVSGRAMSELSEIVCETTCATIKDPLTSHQLLRCLPAQLTPSQPPHTPKMVGQGSQTGQLCLPERALAPARAGAFLLPCPTLADRACAVGSCSQLPLGLGLAAVSV